MLPPCIAECIIGVSIAELRERMGHGWLADDALECLQAAKVKEEEASQVWSTHTIGVLVGEVGEDKGECVGRDCDGELIESCMRSEYEALERL